MAPGRAIQLAEAASAPIANVIAASWNAGVFPVATVSTASSDHIRIAVNPISVAVRGVINVIPGREASEPEIHNYQRDAPYKSTVAELDNDICRTRVNPSSVGASP